MVRMGTAKMRRISAGLMISWWVWAGGCATPEAGPQKTGPVAGQNGDVPLSSNATLGLAWIPAGTFTMGSPADEPRRKADERPQTQVTLTKGYWMGTTLVTIGQWKAVMGVGVRQQLGKEYNDNTLYELGGKQQRLRDFMGWSREVEPSAYLGNEGDNLPMYFVSWNDAQEFCQKLTAQERAAGRLPAGYAYDLPTEAQWENACRAGTTEATYAGPNTAAVLDKIAWYAANSAEGYTGRAVRNGAGPRAVGEKQPNAWGLYDMLGNVWEWCRDWYGPTYPGGSVTDPTGPANGTERVNRGGSFGSGPRDERSANRAQNPPPEASAYRGFRVALCAN
jgi:formylglycine-generating enzyme required for sulfatase activity